MTRRKTTEQFIQEARLVHDDEYDYSKAEYVGAHVKITIICPQHGEWEQTPNNHLKGQGCPKCRIENQTKTTEQFIQEAEGVHGSKYDYSKVEYTNAKQKVIVICPQHGEWEQEANSHLKGCGCPKCADTTKTTEQFIQEAEGVHDSKYDYSKVEYVNDRTKVTIICPQHGEWEQRPTDHLQGHGCPKCSSSVSKPETRWLDYLGIPEECRQYRIKIGKKNYKVDGYDPKTNTVYELHGDFWHGNPYKYDPAKKNPRNGKLFGELYEKTARKAREIKGAGYNFVSIWESDWIEKEKHL